MQAAQRALSAERAALESLKAELGSGRRLSAVTGSVHSGAAEYATEERELPAAVAQSDVSPRRRRVSLSSAPPFALDDPDTAPPPLPFGAHPAGGQAGGVFLSSLANMHGNRPSHDEAAAKEEARRAYVADLNAQVAAKAAAKRAQKAQDETWDRRHGASPPPPQRAMRRQSAVERRDDPVPAGHGRHVQFTQPELGASESATGASRAAAARGPVPMHLQSSVFGDTASGGAATAADALPSARQRGAAIHADLVAGPSDAQKVEAEARRRKLVADLDAQVVQRRADAAARKKAELAAEEEAERQYVAALAAERAKMEKERAPARPMSADSPTGISARPRVWDVHTPEAVPPPPPARVSRASVSAAPAPVLVAAQPPAPLPPSDDGPASREALAMLRLLREEQVRMRDELAAMRQQQSVTRLPRSSITHGYEDDGSSFVVDTAHMPVDASLDMANGVLRPPPAAAQAPAVHAASRGGPAQRTTPRRPAEKGAWAPPAKTRGGWAPPPVPPPSVQRAQLTPLR